MEAKKNVPRRLELLAQCRSLQTIKMSYERGLSNIEFVAGCSELRNFTASQLDGVKDISPLALCPKLETISLSIGLFVACNLKPETVLPLLTLPSLTSLSLDCQRLHLMELPAPTAPNLGYLKLGVIGGLKGNWSTCRELHKVLYISFVVSSGTCCPRSLIALSWALTFRIISLGSASFKSLAKPSCCMCISVKTGLPCKSFWPKSV